jgi:hypothetical protein
MAIMALRAFLAVKVNCGRKMMVDLPFQDLNADCS